MTRRSMRSLRPYAMICIAAACLGEVARGDTLELKDGGILNGTYVGGTASTIRFETPAGIQVIAKADALALTFTSTGPAPPANRGAPQAAATVSIPAGTVLLVRMDNQVSSSEAPGRKFSARLEANLNAGNRVVVPAGSSVYGQVDQSRQAGRLVGRSELELSLSQINVNGTVYPLRTTNFAEVQQKGSFRKTARNTGLGAIIGGAFDGSDGAKKGAAIGAAASVLRQGDRVTVPANCLLEFRLTQAVEIAL